MKKRIFILGSMLAVFSMYGCNPTTSIKLDNSSINISMTNTKTIKATITGANGTIKWSSKDDSIAKVNESTGLVTPVKCGKTQVVASVNGKEATCDVTVRTKTILLGIDGAGDYFNENCAPNIFDIFINKPAQNSVTTKSKGCLTSNPTNSAECWGSMLSGVSPEIHGFDNDKIEANPNLTHPTIFNEAYKQLENVKLASFVNWQPINIGIVENTVNVDKRTKSNDKDVKDMICTYLTNNEPDLLFVQFDSVDHVGHEDGYGSTNYYNQIKVVDGYVKEIYDTLKNRNLLSMYDFIVTADHGGKAYSHGGWSDEEKYIFFGITGDNIQKHEGNKRLIEKMNVIDMTAIAAHALGINYNVDWGKGIEGGIKIPEPIFAY